MRRCEKVRESHRTCANLSDFSRGPLEGSRRSQEHVRKYEKVQIEKVWESAGKSSRRSLEGPRRPTDV